MAKRYSRILSAAKYYSAVDNYIKYITDPDRRGINVGNGKPRSPSQALYVDPFAVALANGQVVKQSASVPTWTARSAQFAGRTNAVKPADEDLIIKLADYKAARVIITTGVSAQGVKKISRVTKLPYLSYGGTSTSVPFGRKDAADTVTAAFLEIKTAITAAVNGASVTLVPEKYSA